MERLTGTIQHYAWGSSTFIPELLGVQPDGEPQAELWLGAHHSAPSVLGGRRLDELVEQDPVAVVGAASVAEFGPKLPFLLKVLAAAEPLSLQAHPSREQAEAGFAREEQAGVARDAKDRLYRDDWPKPEALCALMPSEALCGFRDPEETFALFGELGVPHALELVSPLADVKRPAPERIETVFGRLLRMPGTELTVVDEVVHAAETARETPHVEQFARTARELGGRYPRDPGVLAALLMNRIALDVDDAVYLPAGNLHAYLYGGGIEIMANSDNVLRGGLTPKHVDADELLGVVDFTPGFAGLVRAAEGPAGVWHYETPAPEFSLWRLACGDRALAVPGEGSGRVLLVTDGAVTLAAGGAELPLTRGQSAYALPADVATATGPGTLFVGGSGLR